MVSVNGWSLPRSRRKEPPFYSKSQVIAVLEQVGTLLQLVGANPFRIRAYENAARTLAGHESDLWSEVESGTLTEIKGVGKGIAGLIKEALNEGTWGDIESLYERVPRGLIEMLGVPGLGPKRIKQFYDELGIESVAELQSAADPEAKKAELVDDYTERFANPYIAAERGYIDDVIDPAETRKKIIAGFSALRTKREELPQRKHGVIPL